MKLPALIPVLCALLITGCGISPNRSEDRSIIGVWEIVQMSKVTMPVDKLPKTRLASGRMEFKPGGVFHGILSAPGSPGTNMTGTYEIKGDIIKIKNSANDSVTESRVSLEKEYLVLEPMTKEPLSYVMYLKRLE